MCVIMVATKTRLTEEMAEQAYRSNNAGAGIAWREEGFVRWEKGLDEKQITELCAQVPLPYVAHFRIPTSGGTMPALCHPFPIEKTVSLELSGKTKGLVLFHNGHWSDWKKLCLEAVVRKNTRLPDDRWSDSRAMAWFAAHYGLGSLDMIDEKCVVFGPDTMKFVQGGVGFSLINEVYCSNSHWQTGVRRGAWKSTDADDFCASDYYGGRYIGNICIEATCYKTKQPGTNYCAEHQPKPVENLVEKPGGASQEPSFCKDGEIIPGGEAEQETVQESKEEVRAGAEEEETNTSLGKEMVKWVRTLNPKRHRTETAIEEDVRLIRLADAKNGITRVGSL